MAKQIGIGIAKDKKPKHRKRTSQGLKDFPKNKKKRKNWKAYRGQGRP